MESLRNYTGFDATGLYFIGGTPARKVVEAVMQLGLVRFPGASWRDFAFGRGPMPYGEGDLLPDEPEGAEQKG